MTEAMGELPSDAPETSPSLFWAVVSSTAGLFIASSVLHLILRTPTDDLITDWRLLGVLGLELLMALCWVPVLRRRGWTMRHISHPGATRDVFVGASIALYAYLAYWLAFMVVAAISPQYTHAASALRIGGSVSPWIAILVSVANPVAEEFLYLGFVANALRKDGVAVAFGVSVLLRVLVHLYQGPQALLASIPIGAVLATYYLQSRRIWPAVVAHSFMDLMALSRLMR